RPEHTISNLLHTDSFPDLIHKDMRELGTEANSDIYLYLCQEFARLVEERRDAGLDASWPGEEAIQQLTRMSDRHFIYVVTAVKYVMDPNSLSPPQERLDIILRPKASKYPDLHPLDQLYLQILQPFFDIREELLLPLLQWIMTPTPAIPVHVMFIDASYPNSFRNRNPNDIRRSRRVLAELLNQPDSRQISIILSRLRSVLYVPDDECSKAVSVLHASFSDFLGDQRRSHDFHVEHTDDGHYRGKVFQSSLRVLKRIMLRYGNDQEGIGHREPPAIEAWALDTWHSLALGFYCGLMASESGAETLHAIDEFDVYRYVSMLNDRHFTCAYLFDIASDYIRPLVAFCNRGWNALIAGNVLRLCQVYAFLTQPPSGDVYDNLHDSEYLRLARIKSRHQNRPFLRFFDEDWVAVLLTQNWEVCYLQLKLLIGCLWAPIGSYVDPTSYCGSNLPFPDGDDSGKGTFLKIFPHDVPPSTLAQSMAIEDCQFWRFGFGPWGAFKFRQLAIAPTANGDLGWITVPSESSDLHEWMADFARKQMKWAKKLRDKERREAMEKQEATKQPARRAAESSRNKKRREVTRKQPARRAAESSRNKIREVTRKQEAAKQPARRAVQSSRRLLPLDPESEEEGGKREEESHWEAEEKEWEEFVEEERRYHSVAW
ncbi:hypothetical protein V5O48_012518, partial [Marasmius crinis-equi]